MTTPNHVVIIGGGLAGTKTAEALRDQGFSGAITQIGAEQHLPYERPPLSKGFLMSKSSFDDAVIHPQSWYDEQRIDLRLGTAATAIDPAAHAVTLGDGSHLSYDALVLATGSTPRMLPIEGADAAGVYTLRKREDAEAIRQQFGNGRRLIIIGAGWIGLEVAAAARAADTEVTVIETAALPLLGVLGPELGAIFRDLHQDHEVSFRFDASLAAITTEDGRVTGIRLADGETLPADAVLIGVGVAPEISLAEAAGLAIDNGVLVDASLRTSDPDIYAVGDIANHDHPVLGYRLRVEHWANALNQPAVAAASILGNDSAAYENLPYFYTDQYDLGMEYVGYVPRGVETQLVIRGDLGKREFVAFWLDGEQHILAAMNVNVWDVPDEIKPLIRDQRVVDPGKLADPSVNYAEL